MPSSSNKPGTASPPHLPFPLSSSELQEEHKKNTDRKKGSEITVPSTPTSSSAPSPSTESNLIREYTLAIKTASYQEIRANIHHRASSDPEADDAEGNGKGSSIAHDVQPERASVEKILLAAPAARMSGLISSFFKLNEQIFLLLLFLLQETVPRANTLYLLIGELLELVPVCETSTSYVVDLTPALSNKAFDIFVQFDGMENPFSSFAEANGSGTSNSKFQGIRSSYLKLKERFDKVLDKRKLLAKRAFDYILGICCCQLREDIDAASRYTYVLYQDLDIIERLLTRLYSTIEDDKMLVRLGLEGGRGQRHRIEQVMRHLHKNHRSVLQQLSDMDEHICLCISKIIKVRSLLLQQIHQP